MASLTAALWLVCATCPLASSNTTQSGSTPAPAAAAAPAAPAQESFSALVDRLSAQKAAMKARHQAVLDERYDLANKPAAGVVMSRGKAVQGGVRVKLPAGETWESLSAKSADEIKSKGVLPKGFMPLSHPNHDLGGMVFPQSTIDEIKKQTDRDLTRFDVDHDFPEHFLPEFPPAIFLTTRPDLGDVSRGKLVTTSNFFELFKDILNPKQIEGLRLLVTPFPQAQFNATDDRRALKPSLGVSCFDCHINGHTNSATHTVGDIRPDDHRHRIDTPSLRGVNVQRLFGSQRALKSVEDFTEFEQRAAYFDGDPAQAQRKGVNILERGSQVHFMGEFQALLDFPPAPKLRWDGKLDPAKASSEELRGQELFFGKAQCSVCHTAPYYTDNSMHNLRVERFFAPQRVEGMMATADGPIKTFPLRGIKDSPPYLHDDRLMTLDDTVEFFNLVLELRLNAQEKQDVTAFLRCL
ncbi:MAG TPA: cytochrome B6 [Planctomycetota bacterium]|nr:cytochrome B6 [Planctomycetota bacterium]